MTAKRKIADYRPSLSNTAPEIIFKDHVIDGEWITGIVLCDGPKSRTMWVQPHGGGEIELVHIPLDSRRHIVSVGVMQRSEYREHSPYLPRNRGGELES